mgnify:CR=1 FL=1
MTEKLLYSDSETLKHINQVRENLWKMILALDERAKNHDKSKLESPEREIFAEHCQELAKVEYGTQEYKDLLQKVKPAIDHHYSKCRHHPEHFNNGLNGFDLIDLVEMICDWAAATARNKNGNIHKSIEINSEKYGIPEMLANILSNTVNRYF